MIAKKKKIEHTGKSAKGSEEALTRQAAAIGENPLFGLFKGIAKLFGGSPSTLMEVRSEVQEDALNGEGAGPTPEIVVKAEEDLKKSKLFPLEPQDKPGLVAKEEVFAKIPSDVLGEEKGHLESEGEPAKELTEKVTEEGPGKKQSASEGGEVKKTLRGVSKIIETIREKIKLATEQYKNASKNLTEARVAKKKFREVSNKFKKGGDKPAEEVEPTQEQEVIIAKEVSDKAKEHIEESEKEFVKAREDFRVAVEKLIVIEEQEKQANQELEETKAQLEGAGEEAQGLDGSDQGGEGESQVASTVQVAKPILPSLEETFTPTIQDLLGEDAVHASMVQPKSFSEMVQAISYQGTFLEGTLGEGPMDLVSRARLFVHPGDGREVHSLNRSGRYQIRFEFTGSPRSFGISDEPPETIQARLKNKDESETQIPLKFVSGKKGSEGGSSETFFYQSDPIQGNGRDLPGFPSVKDGETVMLEARGPNNTIALNTVVVRADQFVEEDSSEVEGAPSIMTGRMKSQDIESARLGKMGKGSAEVSPQNPSQTLVEAAGVLQEPAFHRPGEETQLITVLEARPGMPMELKYDQHPFGYVYSVLADGTIVYAPKFREIAGGMTEVEHVDLTRGRPARVSGELNYNEEAGIWLMDHHSAQYSGRLNAENRWVPSRDHRNLLAALELARGTGTTANLQPHPSFVGQ